MSELDLVDWTRVARGVIAADYSLRYEKGFRCEPSEVAKEIAVECVRQYEQAKRLSDAGWTAVGGFWCRIEDGKIAPYSREGAINRLFHEQRTPKRPDDLPEGECCGAAPQTCKDCLHA